MPVGDVRKIMVQQQVPVTGTTAASAAFGADTRYVRLHTDTTCRIRFTGSYNGNAAIVATAADFRQVANTTEYWKVGPGMQLAVISST
jgi:hypothetical protein